MGRIGTYISSIGEHSATASNTNSKKELKKKEAKSAKAGSVPVPSDVTGDDYDSEYVSVRGVSRGYHGVHCGATGDGRRRGVPWIGTCKTSCRIRKCHLVNSKPSAIAKRPCTAAA